ncbi:TPR repeat (fragment) [Candidatus Terasakiella magnetica]
MAGLMRTMSKAPFIVEEGQALPPFDCRISLLSLPRRFWAAHGAVTAAPPYLHPPASKDWPRRIDAGAKMTVGLCWAGRPSHADDFKRSMDLDRLRPLMDIPELRLFSLQIDNPEPGPKALPDCVTDLGPELESFLDTAQAIAALDLVITVDTALAHLAGALGKPVWVMLAKTPDWRWGMAGERTPWYPSMRLFRQSRPGDWPEVIGRISAALRRGQASSGRGT